MWQKWCCLPILCMWLLVWHMAFINSAAAIHKQLLLGMQCYLNNFVPVDWLYTLLAVRVLRLWSTCPGEGSVCESQPTGNKYRMAKRYTPSPLIVFDAGITYHAAPDRMHVNRREAENGTRQTDRWTDWLQRRFMLSCIINLWLLDHISDILTIASQVQTLCQSPVSSLRGLVIMRWLLRGCRAL